MSSLPTNSGKSSRAEYLSFFFDWLHYNFSRTDDLVHNVLIMREVQRIVDTDDEAAYWGDRDCWTMHDIATKRIQARLQAQGVQA